MTSCLNPSRAFKNPEGGTPLFNSDGDMLLPCGTCINCLKIRSIHWATRVQHELSQHLENCFITLTYSDEHCPSFVSFKEREQFTLFIKRLRKRLFPKLIKYIASHEYGTKTKRPHHHLIIFGWTPANWKHQSTSARGNKQYTSKELTELWTSGHSTVGPATGGSAYYIASYALKSKNHEYIDPFTGEYTTFKDKMTASKSLGLDFLIKNQEQLTEHTFLPRYYQKLLKERYDLEHDPLTWENPKMKKRLDKLKSLNPQLHEHYQQRIEALDPSTLSAQEKLAILEISDSLALCRADDLRTQSSIDKKQKELFKERLRNEAERNHRTKL